MSKHKIFIEDFRAKKYCVKGIKAWFEYHNLDFEDFLINGICCEVLRQTEDLRAIELVESKYGKEETDNQHT